MVTLNFSEYDLSGKNQQYRDTIEDIGSRYGFDFAAIGLTANPGAPLKWVYGSGATSDRYKRIALAPGHGIGGIVIKSGKPMMFLDIDKQIDPREYSSYPIVFAEDLQSFCALPLLKEGRVVASLLCAHRSVNPEHETSYRTLIADLDDKLLDFDVISSDFLYFDNSFEERERASESAESAQAFSTPISDIVLAQEDERRRISRELHDSVIQELLSISFLARQMRAKSDDKDTQLTLDSLHAKTENVMDAIHNLSVELRPSTLDHFGIIAALKSQSKIFEKRYGTTIHFVENLKRRRFADDFEVQIYRICQEAILNACKYSGCEEIDITIHGDDNCLYAYIVDKGRGFDAAHPQIRGRGCGLTGIQERASLINATITVESNPQGTRVSLTAPLLSKEKN